MEPVERVTAGLLVGAGVDLQRGADPGVPEDPLDVAGRHLQIFEERSDCVPEVVDLDGPDAIVLTDAPEGPDQVPGPTGLPVRVVNTRSPCWPGRAHLRTVGSLQRLGLELQDLTASLSRGRPRRPALVLTGPRCRSPRNRWSCCTGSVEGSGVQVDVAPARARETHRAAGRRGAAERTQGTGGPVWRRPGNRLASSADHGRMVPRWYWELPACDVTTCIPHEQRGSARR